MTLHARSDVASVSTLAGHTHELEGDADRLVLDCQVCELEIQAGPLWRALWSDDPTVPPLTPKEQQDAERREREGTRAMADLADAFARHAAASVAADHAAQQTGPVDLAAAIDAATPEQLDQLLELAARRKAAATSPAPSPTEPAKTRRTRQARQPAGGGK